MPFTLLNTVNKAGITHFNIHMSNVTIVQMVKQLIHIKETISNIHYNNGYKAMLLHTNYNENNITLY